MLRAVSYAVALKGGTRRLIYPGLSPTAPLTFVHFWDGVKDGQSPYGGCVSWQRSVGEVSITNCCYPRLPFARRRRGKRLTYVFKEIKILIVATLAEEVPQRSRGDCDFRRAPSLQVFPAVYVSRRGHSIL
jgi:hypothetical protein